MHVVAIREMTIDFFEPNMPEKMPEKKRLHAYPTEMRAAMLLALAWETKNSSSKRGRMGEKMVRPVKLRNHRSQIKERNKRAFPESDWKRFTAQF